MSHEHKEESEEDDILSPLFHTCTNPQIGNQSIIYLQNTHLYLFCNILTPPLCDVPRNHSIINIGITANIYPQVEEGILEGVIR